MRAATARVSAVLVLAVVLVLARALAAGGGRRTAARGLSALLPGFLAEHATELAALAAATCEILPLNYLFSRNHSSEMSGMRVVQVTSGAARVLPAALAGTQLLRGVALGGTGGTVGVYVPGWMNAPDDESSRTLRAALLRKHEAVLVLDTTDAFGRDYVTSASKVKAVAHVVFGLVQNLYKAGLSLDSIHLIGFSLGSHAIGVAGRLVQKWLNRKMPSITAMDPAQPCFGLQTKTRLTKNDAKFVYVIHTSAVIGMEKPIGHVDVYANGVGVTQPECADAKISLECDHAQAWRLYSASVINQGSMLGRECRTWKDLTRGTCSGNEVPVGYGVNTNLRGLFLYRSPSYNRRSDHKRQLRDPLDILIDFFS